MILVEILAGCGTLGLFLFLLAHGIARGKLLVLMLALPILCLIGILVAIIELCKPVAIKDISGPEPPA